MSFLRKVHLVVRRYRQGGSDVGAVGDLTNHTESCRDSWVLLKIKTTVPKWSNLREALRH